MIYITPLYVTGITVIHESCVWVAMSHACGWSCESCGWVHELAMSHVGGRPCVYGRQSEIEWAAG